MQAFRYLSTKKSADILHKRMWIEPVYYSLKHMSRDFLLK